MMDKFKKVTCKLPGALVSSPNPLVIFPDVIVDAIRDCFEENKDMEFIKIELVYQRDFLPGQITFY